MNSPRAWAEEEQRHIRDGLTEEELELFDILMKEGVTRDQGQQVKLAARALLVRLHEEKPIVLVEGWFRDRQSRIWVKSVMDEVLDDNLPATFSREDFSFRSGEILDLLVTRARERGPGVQSGVFVN